MAEGPDLLALVVVGLAVYGTISLYRDLRR